MRELAPNIPRRLRRAGFRRHRFNDDRARPRRGPAVGSRCRRRTTTRPKPKAVAEPPNLSILIADRPLRARLRILGALLQGFNSFGLRLSLSSRPGQPPR